jgi:hypothetical protein
VKISALVIAPLTLTFASPGIAASPTTITAADTGHPITLHIGEELPWDKNISPAKTAIFHVTVR